MKFEISLIPGELVNLCKKAANITTKFEADLKSNVAIDIAAVIDAELGTCIAETAREEAITLCDAAVKDIALLQNDVSSPSVQAIFQRLGSDLAHLASEKKHGLGYVIACFQVVWNDVFGSKAD